jgi:cytochrome c-type biogenesis protein CcmE
MNTQKTGSRSAEKRLACAAIVVTCVTGSMAFIGGSTTWQYYLTVEECLAGKASLPGKRIRVNGTVAPSTLSIAEGRKAATFSLKGTEHAVSVVCAGPLPDNLAEGMQVVVEGELETTGRLRGEHVLTRCASKYQSQRSGTARSPSPTGLGSAR